MCDVYKPRAEAVGGKIGAKVYHDFRRVLDKKNVDAVVIATPDHWHALPAVLACQAGKDVYCEKPLALTIREGRAMVQAARKYDRVFQVGTQQRSLRPNEIACKLVREGAMGTVKRVVVSNNWSPSGDRLPGEDVPEGLGWDKWLGQAPGDIPYSGKYIFPEEEPGWSGYYAFSGGEMCGWGLAVVARSIRSRGRRGSFEVAQRHQEFVHPLRRPLQPGRAVEESVGLPLCGEHLGSVSLDCGHPHGFVSPHSSSTASNTPPQSRGFQPSK